MKDRVISEQMLSPGQQPPKIEFPCEYPIKVLGHAVPDFDELVFKAVKKHAPELTLKRAPVHGIAGRVHFAR